jgi:8-hydroxy-5-deazaflavin:NADPH oxidoreductase
MAAAGHQVMVYSRDRRKAEACAKEYGKHASVGTAAEAASFGEAVVFAVPYTQAASAIKAAGDLKERILIDVTKPLTAEMGLALGYTTSGAEEIAKLAAGARVAKAFTIFAGVVANPRFAEEKPSVFVASDNADAKKKALELASSVGFEGVDAGPLKNARLFEPMGMLIISLGYQLGMGTGISYRLMKQ